PEADHYRQIVNRMARKHRLLSVHWELTYRCNERCTHCYLEVAAPNASLPGELTTAQCRRALDQLAELGALHLTFSGGDIFTRRDFFQIAGYARQQRFAVRLMTNAIAVTPLVAERVAALHPTGVEVSLYSHRPQAHDQITLTPGSHAATLRGIRALRQRRLNVVIKMPLMRQTVRDLPAVQTLASELGAQFRYDPTITASNNGNTSNLHHRLTYADLLWLFEQEITPERWVKPAVLPADHRSCSIGMHSLAIDPYGNVFPCVQTRTPAGNLLRTPLRELWEESPLLNQLMHFTFARLPVCRTCELSNICSRCHGLALTEHGDFTAPAAVNCREALAKREVLIRKGLLPADHPLPAHLADGALTRDDLPQHAEAAAPHASQAPDFVPLHALA
ncbi:MAG: radical SAM protein, partial [Chloroflexi bacterium]|nr:radical SAM protein [Chloroflexota bacterium]